MFQIRGHFFSLKKVAVPIFFPFHTNLKYDFLLKLDKKERTPKERKLL
jgi:hypothetical protein